jgi:hypothetical protein
MALLDSLGEKLQTDGVGTLATNIFLGYLRDTPDVAVGVFEDRGNGAEQVFGAGVVAIEQPSIRVVARAARNDYPAARTKILAVRASLGSIRDTTISGVNFMCVIATSDPYPMGLDEHERAMFGLDLQAWVLP